MPTPTNIFGGATAAKFGYTLRWVSSAAAGSGDGTTSAISGANGSFTLAEFVTDFNTAGREGYMYLLQDDGQYNITSAITLTGAGSSTGLRVMAGTGNQNGADNNGGRPIIHTGTSAINAITCGGARCWIENLKITSTSNAVDGLVFGAGYYGVAYNIISDNMRIGIDHGAGFGSVICCECSNTDFDGIRCGPGSLVAFNRCYNNPDAGIYSGGRGTVCLFNVCYDNTDSGIENNSNENYFILFNTCDNNDGTTASEGIWCGDSSGVAILIGNILSNHVNTSCHGVDAAGPKLTMDLFNHYYNNDTDATANTLQAAQTTGDPAYAGSPDFSLGSSSNADNTEFGTPFATTNPFFDKGAVHKQEPTGSGGGGGGTGTFRHMVNVG